MKQIKPIIILLNLVALLVYFHYSIMSKERILDEGALVLLELAPVDPRSLMQGDYMRLNYKIATGIKTDSIPKRGYCVVKLDTNHVASRVRLQADTKPLNQGESLIEYNAQRWQIGIGTDAFFFEEGKADLYDSARYGALRIDDKGHSVLVGMYDERFNKIE